MLAEPHLLMEVVVDVVFLCFLLCSWPLPFPFHEGIPLKESFPFIPFLPFLPLPLPIDLGRKPGLDRLPFLPWPFGFPFLNDRPYNRRLVYEPL